MASSLINFSLPFLCAFVFNFAPLRETKTYLALGDSYTIGESVPATDRYPVQAAEMLKASNIDVKDPEIIAVTGWTTGDLLQAIKSHPVGDGYDLVTLLIGVNNQYQHKGLSEYKKEFTELLQKSIAFAKGRPSRVYVLSIPDYSVTPFASGSDAKTISAEIDAFNDLNKEVSERYRVHYINVTEESRKALQDHSLLASDGLHYTGNEYRVWASLLVKEVLAAENLP